MNSTEDFCKDFPNLAHKLLSSLDLARPGLSDAWQAFERGDVADACGALVTYYEHADSGAWLRAELPEPGEAADPAADAICRDEVTVLDFTSQVPRLPNGRLDWNHTGPTHDMEWAWSFNRHYHLRKLLKAYQQTGNGKYVRKLDELLRDWVISSLPYPGVQSNTGPWRGLEVSFRVKIWAEIFYALQQQPEFSPATRLLMLSSLPDHAHYLQNFHGHNNWITMELSALAMAAAAWPEYRDATAWMAYARENLTAELTRQVYPDGVQNELTSSYHIVSLNNFQEFIGICEKAGEPVPAEFHARFEDMYNYLAYSIKPDGTGVRNNDSDRRLNRPCVLQAAERYNHADWLYIATNGREGTPPDRPTAVFPWAGQVIMRSDFGSDAHWAFFDIGPWGFSHQHSDKLHLSVFAHGRDLLVDSGRFAYRGDIAARFHDAYTIHSAGHNVILIDGNGQLPGPLLAEHPTPSTEYKITDLFDYARGSFDRFEGGIEGVTHTRAVLYVRGRFWVVVDRIQTDQPRDLQALWHWHPDCTVKTAGDRTFSADEGKGNLEIVPFGKLSWDMQIVAGQEQPYLQGWYSEHYNHYQPNPTAVYSAKTAGTAIFGWIIVPGRDQLPQTEVQQIATGRDYAAAAVRMKGQTTNVVVPFSAQRKPEVTVQQNSE